MNKDQAVVNQNGNAGVKATGGIGPFLLVMLILSVIGTTFSVVALIYSLTSGTLSDSVVSKNVFYWISMIMDPLIILGSIGALVLLWMRNKFGIVLKLSLLVLSILVSFSALGMNYKTLNCDSSRGPVQSELVGDRIVTVGQPDSMLGSGSYSQRNINDADACRVVSGLFSDLMTGPLMALGLIFSTLLNVGVGLLWIFAWKDQQKRDGKSEFFS